MVKDNPLESIFIQQSRGFHPLKAISTHIKSHQNHIELFTTSPNINKIDNTYFGFHVLFFFLATNSKKKTWSKELS